MYWTLGTHSRVFPPSWTEASCYPVRSDLSDSLRGGVSHQGTFSPRYTGCAKLTPSFNKYLFVGYFLGPVMWPALSSPPVGLVINVGDRLREEMKPTRMRVDRGCSFSAALTGGSAPSPCPAGTQRHAEGRGVCRGDRGDVSCARGGRWPGAAGPAPCVTRGEQRTWPFLLVLRAQWEQRRATLQ